MHVLLCCAAIILKGMDKVMRVGGDVGRIRDPKAMDGLVCHCKNGRSWSICSLFQMSPSGGILGMICFVSSWHTFVS